MDWLGAGSEFVDNWLPPLQELHARLSEGNDGRARPAAHKSRTVLFVRSFNNEAGPPSATTLKDPKQLT